MTRPARLVYLRCRHIRPGGCQGYGTGEVVWVIKQWGEINEEYRRRNNDQQADHH